MIKERRNKGTKEQQNKEQRTKKQKVHPIGSGILPGLVFTRSQKRVNFFFFIFVVFLGGFSEKY